MAFSGKPFFQIPRPIRRKGFVNNESISANKTLVHKDSTYQLLDGGVSDYDVNLPAELDGLRYVILNAGSTNNLVVKNDAGGTIATLTPGDVLDFVCDGTSWYGI
jgi:hypothetical protein